MPFLIQPSVYAGLGQALSCAALHNRGLLASYILLPKLEMTFLFHQWPQLSPNIAPLLRNYKESQFGPTSCS